MGVSVVPAYWCNATLGRDCGTGDTGVGVVDCRSNGSGAVCGSAGGMCFGLDFLGCMVLIANATPAPITIMAIETTSTTVQSTSVLLDSWQGTVAAHRKGVGTNKPVQDEDPTILPYWVWHWGAKVRSGDPHSVGHTLLVTHLWMHSSGGHWLELAGRSPAAAEVQKLSFTSGSTAPTHLTVRVRIVRGGPHGVMQPVKGGALQL